MLPSRHDLIPYACALILLSTTACSSLSPTPTPVPTVKLKVAITPALSFASLFVAADEGYFTEQGLDVEFDKMGTTSTATPSLISGDIDVLATPINFGILNAIARGAHIKFVADKGYYDPNGCTYGAIVVKTSLLEANKPFTAAQLRGLKVSINTTDSNGFFLERVLGQAGLSFKDINAVNLDATTRRDAIQSGAIDATILGEPNLTQALQTGKVGIWMTIQSQTSEQFGYIIYGPSILDKNPDAGRRFMVAYLKGVRAYNAGKTDRNLDILARNTGLDKDFLKQACWPPFRNDGSIDLSSITNFQNWGIQTGNLDRAATQDQFWDPTYINYANQTLK